MRYGAPAGIPLASTGASPEGVRVVDLNQDGLSDLVYFVGRWYVKSGGNYQWTGDWQYRLSTGAGFTAAQTLLAAASSGAQAPSSPSLYDDNGDGYPDFLYHDVPNRQLRVRRWSLARGAFETGAPTRVRTTSGQDNERYFVADMSGDGNGDLLHISVSGDTETLRVYRHNQAGRAHLMTSVSNGLGAETDITYESLSTTAAYVRVEALHAPVAAGSTPGERRCFQGICWPVQSALADAAAFYTALNAPWADTADPLTDPVTATAGSAPVLELTGPLYVVTRVDSSAPTGSDAGAKSGVGYVYERGKVQAAGRGLLGVSGADHGGFADRGTHPHPVPAGLSLPGRTVAHGGENRSGPVAAGGAQHLAAEGLPGGLERTHGRGGACGQRQRPVGAVAAVPGPGNGKDL